MFGLFRVRLRQVSSYFVWQWYYEICLKTLILWTNFLMISLHLFSLIWTNKLYRTVWIDHIAEVPTSIRYWYLIIELCLSIILLKYQPIYTLLISHSWYLSSVRIHIWWQVVHIICFIIWCMIFSLTFCIFNILSSVISKEYWRSIHCIN